MTYPENRAPIDPQDMAKLHPSTWQQEVEQLRKEKQKMALEATIAMTERDETIAEAKAIRARVAKLEAALREINVGEGWAARIARAALQQPHTATTSAKSDTR